MGWKKKDTFQRSVDLIVLKVWMCLVSPKFLYWMLDIHMTVSRVGWTFKRWCLVVVDWWQVPYIQKGLRLFSVDPELVIQTKLVLKRTVPLDLPFLLCSLVLWMLPLLYKSPWHPPQNRVNVGTMPSRLQNLELNKIPLIKAPNLVYFIMVRWMDSYSWLRVIYFFM